VRTAPTRAVDRELDADEGERLDAALAQLRRIADC
jgi:hypothetical protein